MSDMLPCPNPWCRSHRPERYDVRGVEVRKSLDGWVAECGDCDLAGPWHYEQAKAAEAWNTRPTSDQGRVLTFDQGGSGEGLADELERLCAAYVATALPRPARAVAIAENVAINLPAILSALRSVEQGKP